MQTGKLTSTQESAVDEVCRYIEARWPGVVAAHKGFVTFDGICASGHLERLVAFHCSGGRFGAVIHACLRGPGKHSPTLSGTGANSLESSQLERPEAKTRTVHRGQESDAMKTLATNMRRWCHAPDGGRQRKICVESIKNYRGPTKTARTGLALTKPLERGLKDPLLQATAEGKRRCRPEGRLYGGKGGAHLCALRPSGCYWPRSSFSSDCAP